MVSRLSKRIITGKKEIYFTNWQKERRGRRILSDVIRQKKAICCAISIVRQFSAVLKLKGLLPPEENLSIEELVQLIRVHFPHRCLPKRDYCLDNFNDAVEVLRDVGIVLESANPLAYDFENPRVYDEPLPERYRIKEMTTVSRFDFRSDEDFYKRLGKDLKKYPLACCVEMFDSFKNIRGKKIFVPALEPALSEDHTMILSGSGKTKRGKRFLELQDSYGRRIGHRGFVRILYERPLITEYARIKV